ncbi:unnamed protein product [Notodromas monacha]|uniref:Uncharacterized protein n=1 Tax=Notodromas monacha TaxID=399045 RepID=A0A7R9BXU9_9CRUS|nr:unnamed protein product [Notodromas monacha]CAG0923732.1 unnamed protein product [Notodromas monacha]
MIQSFVARMRMVTSQAAICVLSVADGTVRAEHTEPGPPIKSSTQKTPMFRTSFPPHVTNIFHACANQSTLCHSTCVGRCVKGNIPVMTSLLHLFRQSPVITTSLAGCFVPIFGTVLADGFADSAAVQATTVAESGGQKILKIMTGRQLPFYGDPETLHDWVYVVPDTQTTEKSFRKMRRVMSPMILWWNNAQRRPYSVYLSISSSKDI